MPIKQFTNVQVYRMTQDDVLPPPPQLLLDLDRRPARPLASQELSTLGFIPPFGAEQPMLELVAPGVFQVAVQKQERMLPGKVVKAALAEKIAEIEKEQTRKVYSKERNQLKDEIVQSLLPRAFVNTSRMNALIAPPYIFIDQSSAKKAEDLLSLLRECIGTLPVRPLGVKCAPAVTMTDWALNGPRSRFFLVGESFQARSESSESSTLSGKNVSLSDPELQDALRAGRRVTQLELHHQSESGCYSFTLTEDLTLKGIQWPEEMETDLADQVGEDADVATSMRATSMLLSRALVELLEDLTDALGGEEKPADEDELV